MAYKVTPVRKKKGGRKAATARKKPKGKRKK